MWEEDVIFENIGVVVFFLLFVVIRNFNLYVYFILGIEIGDLFI